MALAKNEIPAKAARSDADREALVERTREANFGGPRMKLAVQGEIPGYHLYWENDDGSGAIEQLLYEGFEFVTQGEVSLTSHIVADSDITSRVSRYAGKQADGSPMRAYLMKCPEEVWAAREEGRLAQADSWDRDIKRRLEEPDHGNYKPTGVTGSINTKYRKEY